MDTLIQSNTAAGTLSLSYAFLFTAAAGALGVLIALTYMRTGKVSKNFARTLIILPMLVSVVLFVVNGNLGTSVAIVGAFGLVRFRSLQGNSRDIAFVFFAMTLGLMCSVGYLLFAAGVTAMVCCVLLILHVTHFAEKADTERELRVTIPENLDYNGLFDDLFLSFTKKHSLVRVKTTNMGSLYELTYHVVMDKQEQEKEFLDGIRVRNGNLTVICGRCENGGEGEL